MGASTSVGWMARTVGASLSLCLLYFQLFLGCQHDCVCAAVDTGMDGFAGW